MKKWQLCLYKHNKSSAYTLVSCIHPPYSPLRSPKQCTPITSSATAWVKNKHRGDRLGPYTQLSAPFAISLKVAVPKNPQATVRNTSHSVHRYSKVAHRENLQAMAAQLMSQKRKSYEPQDTSNHLAPASEEEYQLSPQLLISRRLWGKPLSAWR